MQAHYFLVQDLAVVFGMAAVTTLVCRLVRQPVILGYLLAGLLVGPYTALPLFVEPTRIHALSELGVILVMFSIGLELRIAKLWRLMPVAGLIGLIQVSTMLSLGYLAGTAMGLSGLESLFCGAMVAISSTMIATKALADAGATPRLTELVMGVLVIQDVAAIVMIALLTALASARAVPADALAQSMGQLVAFLLAIGLVGFLVVPRLVRWVAGLGSRETLLIATVGLCFATALLAEKAGYSVALGALLAGSLVAESGHRGMIEELIQPLRDVFVAVFFVAVGMSVDPASLSDIWPIVLVLVVVVVVGMTVAVSLGGFLTGNGVTLSLRAGMSLAQIGEFSFIIVSVGVSAGVVRELLYSVAVATSVITAFTTPLLVRASRQVASWVDRHLPRRLQTLAALYGSWIEGLRASTRPRSRSRRLIRLLLVDAGCLGVLGLLVSLFHRRVILALISAADRAGVDMPEPLARGIVVAVTVLVSVPFWLGIVRCSRRLGAALLERAGEVDLARAPRRVFIATVELVAVLMVAVPLLALLRPLIPPGIGLVLLAGVVLLLGASVWRSAADLHEHVRAGAQLVIEIVERQSVAGPRASEPKLEQAQQLLPGLGPIASVHIAPDSQVLGKTLAELNVRGVTGASVIAITRDSGAIITPTGREPLRSGDILALVGSGEAIASAIQLLAALGAQAGSAPATEEAPAAQSPD